MSSLLKTVLKDDGKKKKKAGNGPIKNRNNEAEKRFRERANGRVKESLKKEEKERK